MTVNVGINGFGRIGRLVLRASLHRNDVEITAINDLTDAQMLAHLLKYDSVHGKLEEGVSVEGNSLIVGDKKIRVTQERNPEDINWKDAGVQTVVEATGRFTRRNDASKHFVSGAEKVIISAPGKEVDATFVMGVNHKEYQPDHHHIVSNASCTTNCLAPVAKVLHEEFGLKRGMMTTVHSYTNDQQILDLPHKDYRRARAAAENIIPTSTGAAKAVALVLPELEGKLTGGAVRVPTPNVSLIDLTAELQTNVSVEAVNSAFQKASEQDLQGILGYSEEPLVSGDYNDDTRSSIVDGLSTMVLEDNLIKVIAWYDNEYAYSNRVTELAAYMADKG
ncbi:type I glyceraldehyde-3-phosphate dehydrogenase [Alteribacillus iranensis]|uniref:Glyceraldehyde-3-phosphate dehydrogenase n=1 Tax=Alteribacillus iranensis TaxID=930128 RepID=A0A1I2ENB2_9BACI|nr:type I glyceraldehyde-3-phosphate dehydrogenase [Alteribacillus iranensis]SFE93841.1 glyceraldehyde-3-phosphate dehydrogenase (NAD+) [Alteribacillus iranensis]